MFSDTDEAEAKARLSLFQTVCKLYEHNRELLDDIIAIELDTPAQISRYIQGMICEQKAYIISNIATGISKSFYSIDGLWTIGRDPRQSDLAVPDKRLSRCHAALQYSPDQGFIISDLESTNGTYVNGEKLQRVYALRDGDRIRIGSSLFHFFQCNTQASQPDIAAHPADNDSEDGRTLH